MRTHSMDSNTHSKPRDGSRQVENSRIGHPFRIIIKGGSSIYAIYNSCEDMRVMKYRTWLLRTKEKGKKDDDDLL